VHMPVQRPGWSNQVSIFGLTEAHFTPVVQQPSNNFGAAIGPTRISWIAVGPVASF
jgi:hypothetical protein